MGEYKPSPLDTLIVMSEYKSSLLLTLLVNLAHANCQNYPNESQN